MPADSLSKKHEDIVLSYFDDGESLCHALMIRYPTYEPRPVPHASCVSSGSLPTRSRGFGEAAVKGSCAVVCVGASLLPAFDSQRR